MAAIVTVGFVMVLVLVRRRQKSYEPMRQIAATEAPLLVVPVAVKVRHPDARRWSVRRKWSRTLGFMRLAVYPDVVAVTTAAGAGRVLGSEWYFRPADLTMQWSTIYRRRWLVLSGHDGVQRIELALSRREPEPVRDALATAGVQAI